MIFFNTNIPIPTKIENQSGNAKNNEVTSIFISNIDSTGEDNIKSTEILDKIIANKKEEIFKVVNSNELSIFNYGIYDNYSRQMIYEALSEANKNSKKVKKNGFNLFTLTPKKKKKNIFDRKHNSDNIRKKIKSRFLKSLKNAINKKLKKAGAKLFFSHLPQCFVCDLSKEKNKEVLNLTLKEIFAKNFCNGKERKAHLRNYEHNLFVLNYLKNFPEISEKSNFNVFKNMKYSEIYNEYLLSKEFGLEITTLKQEKEKDKYIKDYIIKAINFLDFFKH